MIEKEIECVGYTASEQSACITTDTVFPQLNAALK